jgi:voltage-gated potassium channel Kch
METDIGKLHHHAIICGFGRLGRVLAGQLEQGGMPFVILDQALERVAEAREMSWLAVQGEATDELVLRSVGIEHAKVLASVLSNDAANVFITLSAREMNPDIQIIARAELPSTERKLLQAGANRVVLPAHIGADRIAHMILHPNARELLGGSTKTASAFEHHLTGLGLDLEEIEIGPASPLVKRTVGDVELEAAGRFLAVAVLRGSGGTELNPTRSAELMPGDALVVLKREGSP